MTMAEDPGHYSYRVYADPRMAESFDRIRFGGPIGQLLLETQDRVLLAFLGDVRGRSLLDVGTGTGRAALTLARAGAMVVGIDASAEMLRIARARAEAEGLAIAFEEGDAHALACADRSMDAVVSFRRWGPSLGPGACPRSRHPRHQVKSFSRSIALKAMVKPASGAACRITSFNSLHFAPDLSAILVCIRKGRPNQQRHMSAAMHRKDRCLSLSSGISQEGSAKRSAAWAKSLSIRKTGRLALGSSMADMAC